MAGPARNPREKKERSQDRRRRQERDRKAREAAQRFIVPALLVLLALAVALFFWKYGFGGVRAVTKAAE
jgi:hypothetical protein